MAKSHPGELQARAAIRAWLEAGEPRSRASLHREHADIPQRTFYNWVEAMRVKLAAEELPLPPPKFMPTVRQMLSKAYLSLSIVDDYERSWDGYHLLRQSCYEAPKGLNAPLLKRCIDIGLQIVLLGVRIRNEILNHNELEPTGEAMIPVWKEMGEDRARAHVQSLYELRERNKRRDSKPPAPEPSSARNDNDLVRPGLSEALSELQVRELYLLIWSDCLAMRDRAFQLTGDASAALLNLSATCRLKVLDLGIPLPAIFNDQDPYARALDEIVGQFVEAAQEYSVLYYAELTKAREVYGEKEFPYASQAAAGQ